jgi:hypothetical protein
MFNTFNKKNIVPSNEYDNQTKTRIYRYTSIDKVATSCIETIIIQTMDTSDWSFKYCNQSAIFDTSNPRLLKHCRMLSTIHKIAKHSVNRMMFSNC